jgi:predicted short-subunit dehydrogenase-like oxidoreductase (DUF2520 family)
VDVSIVGAGRAATALAVLWRGAGHRIVAVAGRTATPERAERFLPGVPVVPAPEAAGAAGIVVLGVPDDWIEEAASELAEAAAVGPGRWVVHLSGASGLDPLGPAERAGAGVLSLHPLQTFPTVELALERLPGSAAAVTARSEEGASMGGRLAADAGLRPFRLAEGDRPLYHAAAVFASNYLVTVMSIAEDLFRAAGVEDPLPRFLPLARASLENAAALGPRAALTGPVSRGDAGTVERNLKALSEASPQALAAYVALARAAAEVAADRGRLSGPGRRLLEEVLERWS